MELDFSRLNNLSQKPTESPTNQYNNADNIETPQTDKNAIQGNTESESGIRLLQKEANENKTALDRAFRVYKEYQNNIRLSGELQTEIIKGLKAGEDITHLFLKAVKCIALMTSDNVLYSQVEKDIREIYGVALGEAVPLAIELEQVNTRLEKLKAAYSTEQDTNISKAIKQHQARADYLQELTKSH